MGLEFINKHIETIKQIKIKELSKFVNSDEYKKLENYPISYHRAFSYINNHRADAEDIALTLLYKDNILVAYRSLFSDFLYHNNEIVKFSWISGSWVHPNYRRQGYSMKLLDYCFKENQGRLMFSNYAPESKSLYDKSGLFSEVSKLTGFRFYFRFSLSVLLPPKKPFFRKIKTLLSFTDFFLNFYFDIRFYINKLKVNKINFYEAKLVSSENESFIESYLKKNPFKRNLKEINHAISLPWILEKAQTEINDSRYFFSSSSKTFKNIILTIYNDEMQMSGFLLLKIRAHSLTIPYTFYEEKELSKLVRLILFYIKKYRISYLTSFNTEVNRELMKQRTFILFSKNQNRAYFSTSLLTKYFSASDCFFDGDGDSLYT